MKERVLSYLRSRSLMRPGERVAVAVSGGADSVALLRVLLELRSELGIVLSVAHFHHGIRGADADTDQAFVSALAAAEGLELHCRRGDAREYAAQKRLSLETAARALRYNFFCELLEQKTVDRIATAHTLEDQAETVLMKFLRGAGTRGLAGIFPEQRMEHGTIVRPLLALRREDVRRYLDAIGQPWREDLSNVDASFTRNRVRSRVLPMLCEEVNPAVDRALAHAAEIARAEEEYWQEQAGRLLALALLPGEPARGGGRRQTSSLSLSLDVHLLEQQPLAVQRRMLRAAAEKVELHLDFEHVHQVLDLLPGKRAGKAQATKVDLPHGWRARRLFRELRLERTANRKPAAGYAYRLPVPGEARIEELGTTIRSRILEDTGNGQLAAYNRAHSVELAAIPELVVRNWRAGDRFHSGHSSSERRLKELLYPLRLTAEEKQLWPVVAAGNRILWVRGIEPPRLWISAGNRRLWIEENRE